MGEAEEIGLGNYYQDVLLGTIGIATAKAEYMYADTQVHLEFLVGSKREEMWVTAYRLQKVTEEDYKHQQEYGVEL